MAAETLQIVHLEPGTPGVQELVKALGRSEQLELLGAASVPEAHQVCQLFLPCLLVLSITSWDSADACLSLVKGMEKSIRSGQLKVIIVTSVRKHPAMSKIAECGVNDIVEEPVTLRNLLFKVNLSIKAVMAAKKRAAGNTGAAGAKDTLVIRAKEENSGSADPKAAAKPLYKPALQLAEDTFVFRQASPKKAGKKIVLEAEGPDPDTGKWVREKTVKEGPKESWRWVPKEEEGEKQNSEAADGWVFDGEEPGYDPKTGKWQLKSEKPSLYLRKAGKVEGVKVETAENGQVVLAEDSPVALENLTVNRRKAEMAREKKVLDRSAAKAAPEQNVRRLKELTAEAESEAEVKKLAKVQREKKTGRRLSDESEEPDEHGDESVPGALANDEPGDKANEASPLEKKRRAEQRAKESSQREAAELREQRQRKGAAPGHFSAEEGDREKSLPLSQGEREKFLGEKRVIVPELEEESDESERRALERKEKLRKLRDSTDVTDDETEKKPLRLVKRPPGQESEETAGGTESAEDSEVEESSTAETLHARERAEKQRALRKNEKTSGDETAEDPTESPELEREIRSREKARKSLASQDEDEVPATQETERDESQEDEPGSRQADVRRSQKKKKKRTRAEGEVGPEAESDEPTPASEDVEAEEADSGERESSEFREKDRLFRAIDSLEEGGADVLWQRGEKKKQKKDRKKPASLASVPDEPELGSPFVQVPVESITPLGGGWEEGDKDWIYLSAENLANGILATATVLPAWIYEGSSEPRLNPEGTHWCFVGHAPYLAEEEEDFSEGVKDTVRKLQSQAELLSADVLEIAAKHGSQLKAETEGADADPDKHTRRQREDRKGKIQGGAQEEGPLNADSPSTAQVLVGSVVPDGPSNEFGGKREGSLPTGGTASDGEQPEENSGEKKFASSASAEASTRSNDSESPLPSGPLQLVAGASKEIASSPSNSEEARLMVAADHTLTLKEALVLVQLSDILQSALVSEQKQEAALKLVRGILAEPSIKWVNAEFVLEGADERKVFVLKLFSQSAVPLFKGIAAG